MKNDPIVAEVRAIRDALAARCDYDLKKIFRNSGNYKPAPDFPGSCATGDVPFVRGDTTQPRGLVVLAAKV